MGFFRSLFNKPKPHEELKNIYIENGYNKIPVLPKEEDEVNKILANYQSMPMLVPKEYMAYLKNTELVFGHIVMLWWIDNHYKEHKPQYFIYQYGLDFDSELNHFRKIELINDTNELTNKGLAVLASNEDIIRKHKAKKLIHPNGEIEYHYSDEKVTKNIKEFVSTGDFIGDQRIGSSFEKNKDYDNAIKAYFSAIENAKTTELGQVPPNPFLRLAIIFRKLKDKEKEIAILKGGIKLTKYPGAKTTHNKLVERLKKLES